jgi:hypothetical protein
LEEALTSLIFVNRNAAPFSTSSSDVRLIPPGFFHSGCPQLQVARDALGKPLERVESVDRLGNAFLHQVDAMPTIEPRETRRTGDLTGNILVWSSRQTGC